jgi:hypothetical protein
MSAIYGYISTVEPKQDKLFPSNLLKVHLYTIFSIFYSCISKAFFYTSPKDSQQYKKHL